MLSVHKRSRRWQTNKYRDFSQIIVRSALYQVPFPAHGRVISQTAKCQSTTNDMYSNNSPYHYSTLKGKNELEIYISYNSGLNPLTGASEEDKTLVRLCHKDP